MRRCRRGLARVVLLFFSCGLTFYSWGAEPVPRVLIVGDSWAASIATEAVGQRGFGTFDSVLKENGLGQYRTLGSKTAWGGRKASDWAKTENLAKITEELASHLTIDFVHLVVGGNDLLGLAAQGQPLISSSPEERSKIWDKVAADVETIVKHCLAQRPNVRVLICDYDYLDPAKINAAYPHLKLEGMTPRQLNEALLELGRRKLEIARKTPRCSYVANWGVLQCQYVYPRAGLSLPGGPPDYRPYAGGDPDASMPAAASVGDGVHPTDEAHRVILRRCVEQFYAHWLAGQK